MALSHSKLGQADMLCQPLASANAIGCRDYERTKIMMSWLRSLTKSPAVKVPTPAVAAARASTPVKPTARMVPWPAFKTDAIASVLTAAFW